MAAAVETALDEGYRHIDTAYMYRNEEKVGEGLHKWLKKTGKPRSEVFVVSKVYTSRFNFILHKKNTYFSFLHNV